MRVALDSPSPDAKRIYAYDDIGEGKKYTECYCQACLEKLIHKKGPIVRPYFSHLPKSDCKYGKDKDNKSEWHIRMQDYFPKEMQEIRFVDENTNEVHIADVYIPESKTVIEFQKSHIDGEEFWKRTFFHACHGRRVVWVFDESLEGKEYGRLKPDGLFESTKDRRERSYKWLRNPRRFLGSMPTNNKPVPEQLDDLSLCVFTGTEGDIVHRICKQHCEYEYITLSKHNVEMKTGMDIEDFFIKDIEQLRPNNPTVNMRKVIRIKSPIRRGFRF